MTLNVRYAVYALLQKRCVLRNPPEKIETKDVDLQTMHAVYVTAFMALPFRQLHWLFWHNMHYKTGLPETAHIWDMVMEQDGQTGGKQLYTKNKFTSKVV